jgi:Fe-S-cluster containining protein
MNSGGNAIAPGRESAYRGASCQGPALPMDQPSEKLDCLKCPSLCCRLAGYVEISDKDIGRLARHLGLSVRDFEAKHIVHKTRAGKKRIKQADRTCQFLDNRRRCSVYAARPTDCQGYYCWEHDDTTVYDFARFFQLSVPAQRRGDAEADA